MHNEDKVVYRYHDQPGSNYNPLEFRLWPPCSRRSTQLINSSSNTELYLAWKSCEISQYLTLFIIFKLILAMVVGKIVILYVVL